MDNLNQHFEWLWAYHFLFHSDLPHKDAGGRKCHWKKMEERQAINMLNNKISLLVFLEDATNIWMLLSRIARGTVLPEAKINFAALTASSCRISLPQGILTSTVLGRENWRNLSRTLQSMIDVILWRKPWQFNWYKHDVHWCRWFFFLPLHVAHGFLVNFCCLYWTSWNPQGATLVL